MSLKSRPPSIKKQNDASEKAVNAFIEGANKPKTKVVKTRYPWDAPNVREDVTKIFNLRLPEPYMMKLQFLNDRTGKSMHRFCIERLLPEIDKEVGKILNDIK